MHVEGNATGIESARRRSIDTVMPALGWGKLLDRSLRVSPAAVVEGVLGAARDAAGKGLIRRVYRLGDIGKHRTKDSLPEMSGLLEDEIRQTFVLAMSDWGACGGLAEELPLLATAFRISGDAAFGRRVLDQLEEMTSWSPLQRPGWTLYLPGSRLPPDGKDGTWLATGTGIRAIADTLEIMPAGSVPAELVARLHGLLEREIADIVDDWRARRSWFIQADNPITNQWVLPTEGLIRACLVTGAGRHADAYELGVANLLRALGAHGAAGEFEEGMSYAGFTVTSMLHTARAMALAGDRRALDHPFLRRFPVWAAHHFQPGHFMINCFDHFGSLMPLKSPGGRPTGGFAALWSLLATCTHDAVARWVLREVLDGPPADAVGLACRAVLSDGGEAQQPPLFAAYERATRVNWRDSWADDATGVWVRGGHATDQHDHPDRGHVNLIRRGRPILIEAGTAYYDHPRFAPLFGAGCGHNVLQLGTVSPFAAKTDCEPGWQKLRTVAPIATHRLDAAGGHATVDGSKCYDGLESWQREVWWSARELNVIDRVSLPPDRPEIVLFRWHLGTSEPPGIERAGDETIVRWPGAIITLRASVPVRVETEMYPDFTLTYCDWEDRSPDHLHVCLIVRTAEVAGAVEIGTKVV